jgi:hypothetical protein
VTLCAVCTEHKETRSANFLVWPENHGCRFVPVWPQNWWLRVLQFGPQNRQLRFSDLDIKITETVSWFVPQNQVGYSFSVAAQNRWEDEDVVGHILRSRSLLRMETRWARVF